MLMAGLRCYHSSVYSVSCRRVVSCSRVSVCGCAWLQTMRCWWCLGTAMWCTWHALQVVIYQRSAHREYHTLHVDCPYSHVELPMPVDLVCAHAHCFDVSCVVAACARNACFSFLLPACWLAWCCGEVPQPRPVSVVYGTCCRPDKQ